MHSLTPFANMDYPPEINVCIRWISNFVPYFKGMELLIHGIEIIPG